MTAFQKVYDSLFKKYGPRGWWPIIDRNNRPLRCAYIFENTVKEKSHSEIFEICTGAVLTQNTSWTNAEKALVSLIEADSLDPSVLSQTDTEITAKLITSSGYYNMKAKKIKAFSSFFLRKPEPDRKLFLEQWGLGPETVDDMLLYAYDQPVFVIDLYTKRLFSRLGLCEENISYDALQSLITNGIEKDVTLYKEYHALIVHHAKEHCKKAPGCTGCTLFSDCSKKI